MILGKENVSMITAFALWGRNMNDFSKWIPSSETHYLNLKNKYNNHYKQENQTKQDSVLHQASINVGKKAIKKLKSED